MAFWATDARPQTRAASLISTIIPSDRARNLSGSKFTLAVPAYSYEAGFEGLL